MLPGLVGKALSSPPILPVVKFTTADQAPSIPKSHELRDMFREVMQPLLIVLF